LWSNELLILINSWPAKIFIQNSLLICCNTVTDHSEWSCLIIYWYIMNYYKYNYVPYRKYTYFIIQTLWSLNFLEFLAILILRLSINIAHRMVYRWHNCVSKIKLYLSKLKVSYHCKTVILLLFIIVSMCQQFLLMCYGLNHNNKNKTFFCRITKTVLLILKTTLWKM
jgi:hypothetical protein